MPVNVRARCVLYMSQGLSVKMYGFNSKVVCKIMSNVSQMKGWVIHNEGGFIKTVYIVMISPSRAYHNGKPVVISPPGAYSNGGLMKTLHRSCSLCM